MKRSRNMSWLTVVILFALSFSALGVNPARAAGPGAGWLYQRPITLSLATPSANFQIRVQLTDLTNMAANGNDLRFYDSSGVQADYWIEYWNANPAGQATIWVEVPTAGTTSLTIYYGNAGAAAVSNGSNTFIAFDDFSGGAIDTSKWTVLGSASLSGGSLVLNVNGQVTSKTSFSMSSGTLIETVLSSNINYAAGSRSSMNGATSLSGATLFTEDNPVNSQFAAWSNGRDNVYGIHTIHEGDGVDNGDGTSQYLAVAPAGGPGTWTANGYTLGTALTNGRLEYFLNSTVGGWNYTSLGSSTINIPTATMYPVLNTLQESVSITTFRLRKFVVGYNPTVTVGAQSSYDNVLPTVNTFTATSPSTSLNIPITAFTATDDTGVTGYLITQSSTAPLASDPNWSGTPPTSFTVASPSTYTLYPWAKDAAGNVSAVFGSPRTVTVCSSSVTVLNNADSGAGTLRQALITVCPDGTINFDNSLSGGTIRLASTLNITQNLTIDGSALTNQVTISGDTDGDTVGDVSVLFAVDAGITATLNSLKITKGYSAVGMTGVAIWNLGTLAVKNSSVFDNASGGSVIENGGLLTVENSAFWGNSAEEGGAILNDGTATIVNSTISGNTALNGGAIANYPGATLDLINSTISGNTATGIGANIINSGVLNYTNTIIANGIGDADCTNPKGGSIGTNINNLVEDGSCSATLSGDPLLDPAGLQSNGGSTWTVALLPGSPAIDAGDATTCAGLPGGDLDQRGVARHDGNGDGTATCDIGAYEAGTIQCGVSNGNDYTFNSQSNVTLHVNTTTDLDCLYVDEVPVNHPNATGSTNGQNLLTGKYWVIEGLQSDRATTATGFNVDLTLPYGSASTSTRVCKWLEGTGSGFGWDCAASSYAANTSVTRTGLTDLSQWAVGQNVGPTAVTLTGLTAASQPSDLSDFSGLPIVALLMVGLGGWWFTRRVLKFK